ncbi:MAG: hypothetical protein L3J69_19930 [Desulfobacula sp.]|nr:hypothetical protein [Desulfobacula sp.]
MKGILMIGLAILLMSGPGAGVGLAGQPAETNLNRAVIKINTLNRGGCFSTINSKLVDLEGYSGMGANLFRKLIAVDFQAPLTAEKISQLLIEMGYSGKFESVENISEKESFAYMQSKRSVTHYGSGCGTRPAAGQKSNVLSTNASCSTLPPPSELNKLNKTNQSSTKN